jgi:hypothetical protein
MVTRNYITLANSLNASPLRYEAIQFSPPLIRTDTIELTLGGKTDKQNGPIIKQRKYTLRVPIDTPSKGANYGTYSDLRTLFLLSNAMLSPSDVIILVDHFCATGSVYFIGDAVPEPLTTILEGENAWYMVNITLQEKT